MYYLYIKTQSVTGLKYLGYTKRDVNKYFGSGVYWNLHLSKHGYDITTEIIYQSENKEDIKSAGIYYSLFYDVVKSDNWANLIEEKADGSGAFLGFKHKEESKRKISISKKGQTSWIGKTHKEESKLKMRIAKLGKKSSTKTKILLSKAKIGNKNALGNKNRLNKIHTEETKEKIRNKLKIYFESRKINNDKNIL